MMSQYNRESGTSGRNQSGITDDDLREMRQQHARLLEIEFKADSNHALVKNFPGLDAEISEYELRKMAEQLVSAADILSQKNK